MFRGRGVRAFVARSTALAGLLIFAVTYAGASPARAQCQGQQDQPAAAQPDPRYPALQQAVGSYFAEQQQAEGLSAVGLHASLSAAGPYIDVASGSTSFQDGSPVCPHALWQISSLTKSYTAVLVLQLEAAGALAVTQFPA